ncbi:uncharacterized protein KY384_004425 [Bacidia gigantensis]|uniref:uncharacterized protein n=1 Tax=Bacidia gigantensis TaxID=2732470 RepID=UPI001D0419D7|nr:uncharacterized protein KY384_004425 [Bacidia gigantensis]KAG8531068.1 hypothetical protein KY384_004425 [Bacidia gigantensis]
MATTRQAPFNDFYQAAQPVSAYERSVWGLAAILFDDQDSTTYGIPKSEQGKYDARIRKDRLAAFWQQICEEEAETNARELQSAEERAIAFLSANKVGKACETLLQSKNYRLATLIAQIGNNGTMHTEIASQISTWRDLNVLSEISEPIRALYSLLAAQTCTCEGKKAQHIEDRANTFSISERFNLDWKRAFGLRLYYAIETNDPIEVAVAAFAEDIKNDEPKKPGDDLLYALLQVYAASKKWLPFPSLAHILLPQTQEPSALTARLSFQLYCALTGRFPDSADSTVADTISTQFAVQLDAAGEWLWALFALIHISDPTNREQRIKALLAHHAGDLVADPPHDDRWKDIIDIYKVPETWLYQAKALRARAVDHDRLREAGYLVKAEQWVDAHEVLKRVVGPDCVIAEEWDKLQGLLTAFRTSKEKIRGWELGGQVYADYWGIVTEATGGREKGKVLKGLMECLPALLRDVEKGRESEGKNEKELFREMVALEEMKRVTEREVAVMEEQGSDGR